MDGENRLMGNFFKLNVLKKKGFSSRKRRQNDSVDNVLRRSNFSIEKMFKLPWGHNFIEEKMIKLPWRITSLRKKRLSCFGEELLTRIKFLNVKQENTWDKLCANQTFFISLENF